MSYYRPTSGLRDIIATASGRPKITVINKPAQQIPGPTNPTTGGPLPTPAAPPEEGDAVPGGTTPPAASIGGGIPWMLPAIGLVAVGGFLLWRRHKKKGATP